MNRTTIASLLVAAFSLGCAAGQVILPRMSAQQNRRYVQSDFSECVVYNRLGGDRDIEDLEREAVSIVGWTPIGYAAGGILLCR